VTSQQVPASAPADTIARRFPPVSELATVSLGLVVVGGIIMASYAPRRPPLAGPIAIAAAAAALLAASVIIVSRLQEFAWKRFFVVLRWAGLAYVISAGMIAFAFIRDHVSGAPLAVLLVMLVMFASDVPLIIAFTAARYSSPPHSAD
jgi:drug/metabolite transporter (DMT)-like permease